MAEPVESTLNVNGLSHHLICWDGGGETILLCHGFLDIGWGYDRCARLLSNAGYKVYAFDWRGHGETEWIGNGGYYHFADYILDLESLITQLSKEKLHLVGHSMGGVACCLYGGVRSNRLYSLTLIEGMSPPPSDDDGTTGRVDRWLKTVSRVRAASPRKMKNTAEALKRMRAKNPDLPDDFGTFLAERSTKPAADGEGLNWRFDPMHLTPSPMPYRVDSFSHFLSNISVPTLIVLAENGLRLENEADRIADIPQTRVVEFPDAGHMVHWFHPAELAKEILAHIKAV